MAATASGIQAPPGQVEFLVQVTPGMAPGQAFQVTTPDGQLLTCTLPDDFVEGQMIPVFYTPLGRKETSEIGVEPPPAAPSAPSKAEMRIMMRTFKDAKDRWKIDGQTLKGFYLHSESGYLYTWDQPTGILYEFQQATGQCQAVWSAAVPTLNAEIWTVLPLPPTDPASLQGAQNGVTAAMDVYIILTIAHEAGTQLPTDVLEAAAEEFCSRHQFDSLAQKRLRALPPAGQHFAIQNFRHDEEKGTPSARFIKFADKLSRRSRAPWGNSACTLIVSGAGAIIGRSCPDLDALCREDPPDRLAQAHCKIMSEQDRFFVCDMNTTVEGTLLDGAPVSDDWVGPLKTGSLLTLGPLRIKIQLSDMAQDTPIRARPAKMEAAVEAGGEWQRKVYQPAADDAQKAAARRQQEYKDRAEMRRQKSKSEGGSIAIDALVNKFEKIREAEKAAEEAEENRVEYSTMDAHREANMGVDGSFLGCGGLERAGIGFHSQMGGELIPNVVDPRSLSAPEAKRLKTQMRFEQAGYKN